MTTGTVFETIRTPDGVIPARARLVSDAPEFSLDGVWRFAIAPTAATPLDPADRGDAGGWGDIEVPGHWQLQGHGSPAYTNIVYPFPLEPPFVPEANPTGEYRRAFTLPAEWTATRTLLRFDGVDSWFEVWLNGVRIGDSSGSRLTAEFDITSALAPGENLLAVRVHQWSFGSYVEDQDQWWLSGIFRSVTVLGRPDAGIDDVFVHAGYDHGNGSGSLRIEVTTAAGEVTVRCDELGIQAAAGAELHLPRVEPWSAESPRLYDVLVATATETVRLRVGFRTVSIDGTVLLLNGQPLTFRGVNRHDVDSRRGRAVRHETIEKDLLLMKRHNINAVRTSHYPPDPYLLSRCDELGLYVVEECDIETHGFELVGWRGNPSDDAAWAEVFLDRMQRMVERDKNHASVVVWSLGNEAGWGRNLAANAAWTRGRDPERPIHYEQDAECEGVDIYSRMYATYDELRAIGEQTEPRLADPVRDAKRRGAPMIQCEYAHAMGNGPGGLADYEELFEGYPRLAGGFVWEWIDHGLVRGGDHGDSYGYGGDFGETLHDGSFVIDGLVFPDRTPSPGLTEYAAVIAPLRILLTQDAITVVNRTSFTSSSEWTIGWSLERDGIVVADGLLALPSVAPLSSGTTAIPAEVLDALARVEQAMEDRTGETWLTITAALAADRAWALAGHVVAHGQRSFTRSAPIAVGALGAVSETEDGYRIAGAVFDRAGRMTRLSGVPVVAVGIEAWRAPTENDRYPGLAGERPMAELWRQAGLDRLVERLVGARIVSAESGRLLEVRSRVAGAGTDRGFQVVSRWSDRGGALHLALEVERLGEWREPLPRLGFTLALEDAEPGSRSLRWFGLGPGEAYSDSRQAARVGRWASTVRELQTDYVVPQENGTRLDTRWAEIGLAAGVLRIDAETPVGFVARPWSTRALAAATHTDELAEERVLWLHLDVGQNGLGSATCGPGVQPRDRFVLGRAGLGIRFELDTAANL